MSILPGQPYLYRGSPSLLALNEQIMADRARLGGKVSTQREIPPCGTYARYRRHCKAHEAIDEACARASAEMRVRLRKQASMGGKALQAKVREARRTTAPTTPLVPTEPLVISRRKR